MPDPQAQRSTPAEPTPAEPSTPVDPGGAADSAQVVRRVSKRLQRLEQQIRAFRELHVAEVNDLAQRIRTIAQLHADELTLMLDELADIEAELARLTETKREEGSAGAVGLPVTSASPGDPAASSPKRAAWLTEEERRAQPGQLSRRDLLLGRGDDP
jgi:hypothetical protein